METTKICKKCGKELPINCFHKDKGVVGGYKNTCKECQHKHEKQYRQMRSKITEAVRQANPLESFKTDELITELKKRQSKLSLLKQLIFS